MQTPGSGFATGATCRAIFRVEMLGSRQVFGSLEAGVNESCCTSAWGKREWL